MVATFTANRAQPGIDWAWHGLVLTVPEGFDVRDTKHGPYLMRTEPDRTGQTLPTPKVLRRAVKAANPGLGD